MKNSILLLLILISIESLHGACGSIIYVKHDATGFINNGSSWTNAYIDLQSALDEAEACPDIQEIWIAGGVYLPTVDIGGGAGSGIQNLLFNIDFDIRILGGFCGWETELYERVKYLCPTTLCGDHNQDDVLILDKTNPDFPFSNDADNSYNVMRMKNLSSETLLDGVTISGGDADHPNTLSKQIGGAIFNDARGLNNTSSPQIKNCVFQYNKSIKGGGAIYNYGVNGYASPTIITSQFRYNSSIDHGGAFYNHASGSLYSSSPNFTSCLFEHNISGDFGGGFYSLHELSASAAPMFSQSTFVYNEANLGGGLFVNRSSGMAVNNIVVKGCIFFFNNATDDQSTSSYGTNNITITPQYSLYPEATVDQINFNTNANPLFVNSNSNYRLTSSSPAIDKGEVGSGFQLSSTNRDLDDNARRLGSLKDIGAYEFLTCPAGDRIYVDASSTSFRNGATPSSALSSINMALKMACNCDGSPVVDIAEGRYVPHRLKDLSIDEDKTKYVFELECSMELRGEGNTTLSGDILNNDEFFNNIINGPDRDDNCRLLIKATGIETIILDSLRIESVQEEAVKIEGGSIGLNIAVSNSDFSYNYSDVISVNSNTSSNTHSVTIENCRFTRNESASSTSDDCVSVRMSGQTELQICNCDFRSNSMGGVFISLKDSSTSRIERCDFRENTSYIGGGIEIDDILRGTSYHKVTNCTFVDNMGENAGAAIYGRRTHDTNIEIESCTFFRNYTDALTSGSVNFFNNSGSAKIKDCIFWENTNQSGSIDVSGDMDISYSMLGTETCPASSGVRCKEVMLYNVDPMFRSEGGTFGADLNLNATSTAINRGSKTASGATGLDFSGNSRIESSRIDLGAYERQSVDCPDVVVNPVVAPETQMDLSIVAQTSIELSQNYITPTTGALFIDAPQTSIYPSLEIEEGAIMEVYIFGCND